MTKKKMTKKRNNKCVSMRLKWIYKQFDLFEDMISADHKRPSKRSECPVERPCPFVGCKYHLYLDITKCGNIRLNFPDKKPWEMEFSCMFDILNDNATLEEVGKYMNISRERVRQIVDSSLQKMKVNLEQKGKYNE